MKNKNIKRPHNYICEIKVDIKADVIRIRSSHYDIIEDMFLK